MRRAQFEALLPGGPAQALQALLQFAVGHNLAADVSLVLDKRDVPPSQLGGRWTCGWAAIAGWARSGGP